MARYQSLYLEANDKLIALQKERSAIDQLMTRSMAFEAAMKVLARHKLMTEFADELSASMAVTNGDRE